jgi:predicted Rossmann fold nucleotide-binding protein DprA/Smf involved in DNA uptake
MKRLVSGSSLALLLLAVPARAAEMTERQKIEALIKHVEGLQDAKFVRNGTEHDAKTAAKFLRGKWESNEAEIKTAKDFIDKAATKSSTTGKPYLIRFKDGKEVPSADYLRGELKKLEMASKEKRDR